MLCSNNSDIAFGVPVPSTFFQNAKYEDDADLHLQHNTYMYTMPNEVEPFPQKMPLQDPISDRIDYVSQSKQLKNMLST